ncbi:hypothetical protein T484DRAFT_1880430 [Baffinella frigidus]|nr:hypothetical protein T484DRAFT_1880430 [Cryptophyta sp. CCMP2293]
MVSAEIAKVRILLPAVPAGRRAIAEYADVAKRAEKEAMDLDELGKWENDGSDARANLANLAEGAMWSDARTNLANLAEGVVTDATKFQFLFKAVPTTQEAVEILRESWPLIQKFVAWCHAVSSEGPAIHREVTLAGRISDTELREVPSNQLVIKGGDMFKRLSKSPQAALQKQLLRDAAGVKTMIDDVAEMVESNKDAAGKAAERMGEMGLEDEDEADRDDQDWDDMMNMNVNLSPAELKIAEASVAIARACMAVLKAGVKLLSEKGPAGVDEAPEVEALSKASRSFSVACEDLGALCVLDQGECAGCAATILDCLVEGVGAVGAMAGRRAGQEKHGEDAREALETARTALKAFD